MPDIALRDKTINLLNQRLLGRLKTINLRSRMLSRVLQRTTLTKNVVKKLAENMAAGLSRTSRNAHSFFDHTINLLTYQWSNLSAKKRGYKLSFLGFLTVIHINTPRYSNHNRSHPRMCLKWS